MVYKYIQPETYIAEIAEMYPEIVNVLINEYGFHCIGCFASQFETLEQGAMVHGIYEEDFENMLKLVNELAEKSEKIRSEKQKVTKKIA